MEKIPLASSYRESSDKWKKNFAFSLSLTHFLSLSLSLSFSPPSRKS